MKNTLALILSICMVLSVMSIGAYASSDETLITLSDSAVTASGDNSQAVYTANDIIYYAQGNDSSYGAGSTADEHSANEADMHTVVHISQAGTYRVSGTLSYGQIAVDLGEDAQDDSSAVVTLILDNTNITCTVAPAIIFYNVYESNSTTQSGANIVLADGSVNTANGSYVAKIYESGTTNKLYKFDGAVYSKMSLSVAGESTGTGKLTINAENEGLDSEMHLTINSGNIYISADNDGINTNEDGTSITTINGGYLYVNAGLGNEGDGIDSNGQLIINGGEIVTVANGTSGDGGIDADSEIVINGGSVIALGNRNDATSSSSDQPYMELSFSTTKASGSVVSITKADGTSVMSYTAERVFQSLTYSSELLNDGDTYYVYIDGVQQQFTSNQSSAMGGGFGGTQRNGNMQNGQIPQDNQIQLGGEQTQNVSISGQMPQGENNREGNQQNGTGFEGRNPGRQSENNGVDGRNQGMQQGNVTSSVGNTQSAINAAVGSTEFTLSTSSYSFSGVSDSTSASGKTQVVFHLNTDDTITNVASGESITAVYNGVTLSDLSSVDIDADNIQFTITDVPSEDYCESVLLSDGDDALESILPTADGTYMLTIALTDDNDLYAGSTYWYFSIGDDIGESNSAFSDVSSSDWYYESVKQATDEGIFYGTGDGKFSPNSTLTRGMFVTILGRIANADVSSYTESSFEDVSVESYYSPYIEWAVANGIASGMTDDEFSPDTAITREQMCVMLYNYAEYAGISIESDTRADYSDSEKVSDFAKEAVNAMSSKGVFSGDENGNFSPKSAATRAQAATVIVIFIGM